MIPGDGGLERFEPARHVAGLVPGENEIAILRVVYVQAVLARRQAIVARHVLLAVRLGRQRESVGLPHQAQQPVTFDLPASL